MAEIRAVSMVGGTIRRKLIHRESFRASVLHHSENQPVLQSSAANTCLLTTPSFLSKGTRKCNPNGIPTRKFKFKGGAFRAIAQIRRDRFGISVFARRGVFS
jgi:hypothetical protein